MKKQNIIVTAFIAVFLWSTPVFSQTKTASDSTSMLGKFWNKITGSYAYSQKDLVGKWNFQSTACKFETENLLKKAGGAIVATQVENAFDEYCEKFAIRKGNCSYTFNTDSTYSAKLGTIKLSGKYKMNNETNMVTMTYALGVGKMHTIAVKSGNNLKLYYDADGFLKMMKTLSLFTNNNKVEILAKMAELYDGMLLGFDLDKEK